MKSDLCRLNYISSSISTQITFLPPYDITFNTSSTNVSTVNYTMLCREGLNNKVIIHLMNE